MLPQLFMGVANSHRVANEILVFLNGVCEVVSQPISGSVYSLKEHMDIVVTVVYNAKYIEKLYSL